MIWELGLGQEPQSGFPGEVLPPGHVWEHSRVTLESLLEDWCPINGKCSARGAVELE